MDGWMDGQIDRHMDLRRKECMNECMDGWMNACMGWMDVRKYQICAGAHALFSEKDSPTPAPYRMGDVDFKKRRRKGTKTFRRHLVA
jgi:hypothetical protein